jgi:polyhydroxybutyrate depolymerase
VGTVTRTFIYYAPPDLDPNEPAAIVISPHGFAMTSEQMYVMTGFKELADRERFVAIFPEGNAGSPWNVGAGVSGAGALVDNLLADDQSFIDAILVYAMADQCIDARHVFVSGFSMGGYFSNENGCVRSDIAGIGPHSGGSHDLSACTGSIKPVIIFHGDVDGLITYQENGVLTRDRWVARNGCRPEVDARPVKGGTCEDHRGCPPHGQVTLCHFDKMDHLWAGGTGDAVHGDPTRESAAALAWSFWRQHAW